MASPVRDETPLPQHEETPVLCCVYARTKPHCHRTQQQNIPMPSRLDKCRTRQQKDVKLVISISIPYLADSRAAKRRAAGRRKHSLLPRCLVNSYLPHIKKSSACPTRRRLALFERQLCLSSDKLLSLLAGLGYRESHHQNQTRSTTCQRLHFALLS